MNFKPKFPKFYEGEGNTPSLAEVHTLIKDLRSELEQKSVDMNKVEKIQGLLDKAEEKNQKIVIDLAEAQKRAEETKSRIDDLEAALARGGENKSQDYREMPEYKALDKFVKSGKGDLAPEEKALLRTDIDTSGGYLTTSEMDPMIIKQITEISNMRSVARVRSIGRKSLEMPKRTGILTATFEGENEANAESASTYGSDTLTTWRQTVTVPITQDMLMNSEFNMETEIFGDANESFAQGEGFNFVNGTGSKSPEGFLANTTVQANFTASGIAGAISADVLIEMTGELKVGYNPMYAFNRQTLAKIRTLKGGDGQYLWQPGMNGVVANSLNGFPYIVMQDMPAIATDAYPIAFADFARGYQIVDRTGVAIIRDDVTQANKATVLYTLHRWLTGQVILPEAFWLMKIS